MKVQVVAGANAIEEIKTIKVTLDTGAKSDLISIELANSLRCKIKKIKDTFCIMGVNNKPMAIYGTTTIRLSYLKASEKTLWW